MQIARVVFLCRSIQTGRGYDLKRQWIQCYALVSRNGEKAGCDNRTRKASAILKDRPTVLFFLEKMKGLDVVQSYLNDKLAEEIINFIASVMRRVSYGTYENFFLHKWWYWSILIGETLNLFKWFLFSLENNYVLKRRNSAWHLNGVYSKKNFFLLTCEFIQNLTWASKFTFGLVKIAELLARLAC